METINAYQWKKLDLLWLEAGGDAKQSVDLVTAGDMVRVIDWFYRGTIEVLILQLIRRALLQVDVDQLICSLINCWRLKGFWNVEVNCSSYEIAALSKISSAVHNKLFLTEVILHA